jgi:FlaA1/EpsC-like NDP-sugar epimerase
MKKIKKVLIYGAGEAGTQIAAGLMSSKNVKVAGFIDDDVEKKKLNLFGLKIITKHEMSGFISEFEITDILIAIPSLAKDKLKELIRFLNTFPVHVKALPRLDELISENVGIEDIREIDIEDILGRSEIPPNINMLREHTEGKIVLITGAGGSIGSELCRQIIKYSPKKLILIDVSEYALYTINKEILSLSHSVEVEPLLLDVKQKARLANIFKENLISVVYHAAAYKHVPLVESNVISAVENNIIGTLTLARLAIEHNVDNFLLISSDKAVRPTNVMGATKRISELIVQSLNDYSLAGNNKTKLCAVRFGNVLNSSGSVVPLFKDQIAKGGPVTVTHKDVLRYFMTIREAAQLVIQAIYLSDGGDVMLLDMGESVKILELAISMVNLSGHTVKDENNPDGDIEIIFTGLRPGEKLFEELLIDGKQKKTSHPKIFKALDKSKKWDDLFIHLKNIQTMIENNDICGILDIFSELVDGYSAILGQRF